NVEIKSLSSSSSRRSFERPPLIVPNSAVRTIPPNPSLVGIVSENIGLPRPGYQPNEMEYGEPTASAIDPELNVLEKPFQPDREFLNKEFGSSKNEKIRNWYFNTFSIYKMKSKMNIINSCLKMRSKSYFLIGFRNIIWLLNKSML